MISEAARRVLIERYAEPHRRYHTMAHIQDCLAQVAQADEFSADDRRLLEAAVWFHDAVYDPARGDNEAESAALARTMLTDDGWSAAEASEVSRLILLTAGHRVAADDPLGARLTSIDLSVLGAAPERYDAYAAAIREEYAHVPEPLYRTGRAAILNRFLADPVLFPDPAFAARLDAQARANLRRELESLAADA